MERLAKIAAAHSGYINSYHKYRMLRWDKFDYSILSRNIMYYKKKGKFQKGTWNDIIIAADTETSKSHEISSDPLPNHVVAWTISIRAYHCNICTIYGTRPSEMMDAFKRIRAALKGDEIYVYFHNLAYDYVFLRLFFFAEFGYPIKELNTKPHYPILLTFENGIILKDSLILAGCKLEKWANDLNVHHKKAVGSWDYEKVRDQVDKFTRDELHYIENDTLALAECLDAFCISLNKNICTIPYTATGIPREEVRKRGKDHNAHRDFMRQALDYNQYCMARALYHGGYCQANRFHIGEFKDDELVRCKDFASSYPFCLCAFPDYPVSGFTALDKDVGPDYILRNSKKYAFMFKVSFINIKLKDRYYPMPALQASKCEQSINMRKDNGRIISAGYCTLYMTEIDLEVIDHLYTWDECRCTEVQTASKGYLPRWFTDYVFELYEAKCKMKPLSKEDPVGYSLAKSRVNSVYGLTVQACVRENYIEVREPGDYKINRQGDTAFYNSGEYRIDYDQDMQKEYERYLKSPNTVISYTVGVWCTALAFRNLFRLGECVNFYYENGKLAYPPQWLYSDTDSCYSSDWNEAAVAEYNENCKKLLKDNGYGAVVVNGKEYWLGFAENDSCYEEWTALGSKRYAGRDSEDHELHITVAGVPKKGAKCLKDDLHNFTKGFIFDGETTGKLSHFYIFSDKGIYIDEFGNEIGDSIELQPCDYLLDAVEKFEYIMTDDYFMEYYGEETDLYDL